MKTYVLMLADKFPATHQRKGEPTMFYTKVRNGINLPIFAQPLFGCDEPAKKIHTIRKNAELWIKRFEEIDSGKACLSLRMWEGKPYKSKQIEIARLTKEDGIGIQVGYIGIEREHPTLSIGYPENGSIELIEGDLISYNDGLTRWDWCDWFKNYDLSKPMAIIQFTKFRY